MMIDVDWWQPFIDYIPSNSSAAPSTTS
jgi:hypothetical protein